MIKWKSLLTIPMMLSLALNSTMAFAQDTSDSDSESGETTENTSGAPALSPEEAFEYEDLYSQGIANKGSTITGIDMTAEDWVDQAAAATEAVEGSTFVRLDSGLLTVDQLNAFLKANPFELTYSDDNNQFLYYNHKLDAAEMLGARRPDQTGNPLADVHPESALVNVAWVVNQLREGHTDHVRMAVPNADPEKFVVHDYYAIRDDEGNFMGVNEVIWDIQPVIDFWMQQNNASYDVDVTTGATEGAEESTVENLDVEDLEDSSEETDTVDGTDLVEDDNSEEMDEVEETEATEEDLLEETEAVEEKTEADTAEETNAAMLSPEEAFETEDIYAEGESEHGTTITEVDFSSENWTEEAAEAVDAVDGDTYVKLDSGVLTVDQINEFLKAQPVELTYADDNNQFLFYNYKLEPEEMLGSRRLDQVGSSLADVHPESAFENLSWVINQLREGHTDHVRMAVPNADPEKFVVHDYYGIYDEDGNYMGINEVIWDIQPVVDFWIQQTGAEIDMSDVDINSGATESAEENGEETEIDVESVEVDADFSNLEDGTYTGSAQAHNGALTVEVIVEGGAVTAVDVLEHNETEGIADPAIEEVPAAIVDENSAEVDTVSGATITSQAIMEAVKDIFNQ